jgi:hypothetical protein
MEKATKITIVLSGGMVAELFNKEMKNKDGKLVRRGFLKLKPPLGAEIVISAEEVHALQGVIGGIGCHFWPPRYEEVPHARAVAGLAQAERSY